MFILYQRIQEQILYFSQILPNLEHHMQPIEDITPLSCIQAITGTCICFESERNSNCITNEIHWITSS